MAVALTSLSHGAGCGCKLPPAAIHGLVSGLPVTGLVHPDAVLTNGGGVPGDRLVLTKPLGAGAVSTAAKRGLADAGLVARATAVMCELNAEAARAARAAGAHALTDVTGFG